MHRRKFITFLGGAAAAPVILCPRAAQAQDGRVRRIAVLVYGTEGDAGWAEQRTAFQSELARLGWVEGRNLRIDMRFGAGDINRIRADAADMVSLMPNVIVASSGVATRVMQAATQTIPIVFPLAGDAVAAGLVKNIARPEGNVTGFSVSEPTVAGKLLGLLKEAAPQVSRVAVLFNPDTAQTGPSYLAAIERAAPALSVDTAATPYRDALEAVRAVDAFAATPGGGLLLLPPAPTAAILTTILRLAEQHRLPAVFTGSRVIAAAGGLITYGTIQTDLWRGAATYVDRLLRGAKVSDLPVQFPTKYELVVNLKAAKAIGLAIPEAFLLRVDELIE